MSSGQPHDIDTELPHDAPELIRRFTRFWMEARRGRTFPRLGDLDPVGMPWALAAIFILKRRPDGVFYYHLVGEKMTTRLGGSLKGKTAHEVFEPEYAEWTDARWEQAAREVKGCYVRSYHLTVESIPVCATRVLFPVGEPPDSVDALVGVAHFETLLRTADGGRIQLDDRFIRWLSLAPSPSKGR